MTARKRGISDPSFTQQGQRRKLQQSDIQLQGDRNDLDSLSRLELETVFSRAFSLACRDLWTAKLKRGLDVAFPCVAGARLLSLERDI